MADPAETALRQIQLMAATVAAALADTLEMIALHRVGHPRAQDFEPTGHGASDPTSDNGVQPDKAVRDGRTLRHDITTAHKAMVRALDITDEYRAAERPQRKESDVEDIWCVLHLKFDAHEPRYRGLLCRPCYEQQGRLRERGQGELTDDMVRHHATYDKWPRSSQRVDPKAPPVRRIAGLENLQDGLATLKENTA